MGLNHVSTRRIRGTFFLRRPPKRDFFQRQTCDKFVLIINCIFPSCHINIKATYELEKRCKIGNNKTSYGPAIDIVIYVISLLLLVCFFIAKTKDVIQYQQAVFPVDLIKFIRNDKCKNTCWTSDEHYSSQMNIFESRLCKVIAETVEILLVRLIL